MPRPIVLLWIAASVLCAPMAAASATLSVDSTLATAGGAPAAAAVADSSTLDLEFVLRRTIARNPSIAAARATWEEAQARARQAGALEDPMLDLMAAPASFGSSAVDAAYRFELTQALPIFGQRGLRSDVARQESRVVGFDLRTLQLDLLRDARTAYFEYWRVVRAADFNRELLRLMAEFRRATLAKYS